MQVINSRFIYAHEVLYFITANRTVSQIFTALDTSCIMLARHIYTIFVVLKANYTRVLIAFLTYQRSLNFACVCLVRPEFKY